MTGTVSRPAEVPRSARRLVGVLLVLLLVPGLIGFDVWPLTGWRLFSVARGTELLPDESEMAWGISSVDAAGDARVMSLEELPLGYRHAQWPMKDLPERSLAARDALCTALLDAAARVRPATVGLQITVDRARIVRRDGEWVVEHDRGVFHACGTAGDGGRIGG